MLNYILFSLAFVAVSASALPTSEHSDDHNVDKHKNCTSKIPAMADLDPIRFAGKWYVDSSAQKAWLQSQCNEYYFKWHAQHYVHKNLSYDGFFTYNLREINGDEEFCWEACAYTRLGYLYGRIQRTIYSDCFFNATATDIEQVAKHHAPCYPKYKRDWKQWVLATDYTNYSIMWLCSRNLSYITLQSRTKAPLSAAVRKQAQMFLEKHGYNLKLMPANNTAC